MLDASLPRLRSCEARAAAAVARLGQAAGARAALAAAEEGGAVAPAPDTAAPVASLHARALDAVAAARAAGGGAGSLEAFLAAVAAATAARAAAAACGSLWRRATAAGTQVRVRM